MNKFGKFFCRTYPHYLTLMIPDMRTLICIALALILALPMQAQKGKNFDQKFISAKNLLYDFHPEEALPILLDLLTEDPDNANLHYLIGACYTDYDPESDASIKHLIRALPAVSDDYDPDSPDERNSSIHLYYFLAVAYAQNHRCDEAKTANETFRDRIGRIGGAYIRDAQFWVDGCYTLAEQEPEEDPVPYNGYHPDDDDPNAIKNAKIVTQSVEYTTPAPLYGVQVGSFSKYVPIGDFDDIKNVDAFIDNNGKVRYVVGSFALKHQAETLLRVLQESGYKDAYIVDVNKERRYHDRIITVNNMSIKAKVRGKVHFRCQIGAFRDTIPREMAEKYVKVDGIIENKEGELTLLSVGKFETYEEAANFKTELKEFDINDAFVVAYNYDTKIPLKKAKAYIEEQEAAKMEEEDD